MFLLKFNFKFFNLNYLGDVRDVALAHIKAMTLNDAVSKRHIIATITNSISFKTYAQILDEEFKLKGYRVPTLVAPNTILKIMSLFDKTIKFVIPLLGKRTNFNNERFIKVLAITPIDYKRTILEMAYDMIEKGYITKRY
jgi:dihydroflavonol-4-reductase